ncbi:hypothetical protein IWQ60_001646 [Tieghemiomyces parasiticus]|uniref:NADH-cytochrome b5 reductase n=1 Tax=Tieghemiomyces parasiticus TaxID=78921 RepID=A0A9W8E2C9_9FUNG|nr:hypothetical protein IWQ60_001646 [Tieghemiomyces parasiticus]
MLTSRFITALGPRVRLAVPRTMSVRVAAAPARRLTTQVPPASAAPNGDKSSSNLGLWAAVLLATVGGGYYYLNREGTSLVRDVNKVEKAVSAEVKKALTGDKFQTFTIKAIRPVSHNTSLYTFELPDEDMVLGLDVASCLLAKLVEPGTGPDAKPKVIIRPYTPVSSEDQKATFDLLIKHYPEGKFTSKLATLKPGDKVDIKGPIPKYKYTPNMHKEIGIVVSGSGLTPGKQLVDRILANPDDHTKVSLLYGNLSEDDILLRDELDALAKQHPDRLRVHYTVDKAPKDWPFSTGYVTKAMAKEYLPAPGGKSDGEHSDTMIFVCGPPPMVNAISGPKASITDQGKVSGILKELGYDESNVFKF